MIDLSSLRGQKYAVMGLGKTGLSAARSLQQVGVKVVAWDDNATSRQEAVKAGVQVEDLTKVDLSGYKGIIWSPGIPHSYPHPHKVAEHARKSGIPLISDIDILIKAQPDADYIGITGTNGKSTTTALIGHMLKQFRQTETGGNIGVPVLSLTPVGKGGTYVLELSSYQTELTPSFSPAGAVLLNITPDHLARHGGMAGYIAAKKNIFNQPKENSVAVICIDTDICRQIADELRGWKVIRVSTHVEMSEGVWVRDGQLFDKDELVANLNDMSSLKGRHNHENAACAYAVLRYVYGYDPAELVHAMTSFGGLQHRQYLVRKMGDVSYINDSKATNADATSKALASFDDIYWILGGQPKEGGLSGLEGFMNRICHAYVIGEATPLFVQWLKGNNVPYTECGTLDKAVAAAHQAAHNRGKGSVLLSPACASWDQFTSFEHRGQVFADIVEHLT